MVIICSITHKSVSSSSCRSFLIPVSFAIPVGSTIIRSGAYSFIISKMPAGNSLELLQQIQPACMGFTVRPSILSVSSSMLILPNSFSRITIFSPGYTPSINFLIKVVLPAPKKPDMISILVFFITAPIIKNPNGIDFFRLCPTLE